MPRPLPRRLALLTATATLALCMGSGPFAAAAWAKTPANMLVIANRIDDITTLDPAESFEFAGADVIRNVYGKLVNFDPLDLKKGFQPDIATGWTVSEDGRTITFAIRDGLKFHSGNPVRAEDAAFSLQRAVKLNRTPAFILGQFGFTPQNVEQKIRVDGGKLVLETDKKYATTFVLNCLTATIGAIVDQKTVMSHDKDGDLGNDWLKTNSAGSGAYKLVDWKPSTSVTLVSNPDFYLGAPAMKRVIVRHIQESATQRLLLEKGDIDVARNLNPEDVASVEKDPKLEVTSEQRGRIVYLGLNQKDKTLSNPKFIEAVKYLIDYKGIVNSFLKGQYEIHQTFLPATYLGALDDTPFKLDIPKAKALLKEGGIENAEFELGVRDAQERVEIAQSLQNTFGQAGIKLNITTGTGKQILTRYRARDIPITLEEWGPDYPDPQTNAGTFAYNPDNSDAAKATGLLAYRIAWSPGDMSQKVLEAVTETDQGKRVKMYEDLQREFQARAPFVMMFQKIEQFGKQKDVENLTLGGAITSAAYWPVVKK